MYCLVDKAVVLAVLIVARARGQRQYRRQRSISAMFGWSRTRYSSQPASHVLAAAPPAAAPRAMETSTAAEPSRTVVHGFDRFVDEDGPLKRRHRPCFYGWVVIFPILTFGQMSTFFGTSSATTFVLDPMMADLDLSRSMASFSYAAGTFAGAALQIPIGRAVDHFGGRKSVTVCSAAFYLSLMAMALPHDWYVLTITFLAMRALGFGGLALACTTCLQQWFVKRRGLATGLSEGVNTLVGFGLNSQLYAMSVRAYGWRASYVLVGALLLAFSPIAALLLRSRPEEMGLLPDGDRAQMGEDGRNGGDVAGTTPTKPPNAIASPPAAASSTSDPNADHSWTLREAMKTTSLWIIVAANALQWGIGAGFFFHLASIASEFGLPVVLLPACFYLPWALLRAVSLVLGGYLLDRIAPRSIMFVGFMLGGLAMLGFGWPGSQLTPGKTIVLSALWGLSMGLGKATFSVCPAMFFGRRHLGSIQGVLQTTNVASTAVGPLIVGITHDQCRDYTPILLTIGGVNILLGAVGALFLRVPKRSHTRSNAKVTTHTSHHTTSPDPVLAAADHGAGGAEMTRTT